jgi:hypothetical protein
VRVRGQRGIHLEEYDAESRGDGVRVVRVEGWERGRGRRGGGGMGGGRT